MTNILIQSPFEFLTDKSGDPLSNGFIYIGEPGKDPEEFPLPVYFDADGIVSAPTPLRTNTAGYPTDGAGNPKRIFTTGPYSLRLRDKNNAQVYYSADSSDGFFGVVAADLAGPTGSQLVGYRSGNVYEKLTRLGMSPQDFGAIADGVNNDQEAFEQAVAQGVPVYLPPGNYNIPTGDFSGTVFYTFGGAISNNATVGIVDVTANAFPVGAVMQFPCAAASLPPGFLPLDGSLLNREVYAALWSFANSSGNIVADAAWAANKMAFSTGNASTTFRVPDARGLVVAGADNGALVDTDFVIGSVVNRTVTDGTEPGTTDFNYGPQTVAIRAFSGAVNPGLIDITALGAQVNGNTTNIAALEDANETYTSSDLPIVLGGDASLSHGLGVVPFSVSAYLICVTAEYGYDAGDIVDVASYQPGTAGTASSALAAFRLTSSQILVKFGNNRAFVPSITDGLRSEITVAKWRLRVRARK